MARDPHGERSAPALPFHSDDRGHRIVDPIDGTQNFIHDCPLACVSIGFCDGGKPLLGVVFDPYADELYFAIRGVGSYIHSSDGKLQKLKTSSVTTLGNAMLLTDPGYCRSADGVTKMCDAYKRIMLQKVQAIRVIGSSVLSIVWVARGRVDGMPTDLPDCGTFGQSLNVACAARLLHRACHRGW